MRTTLILTIPSSRPGRIVGQALLVFILLCYLYLGLFSFQTTLLSPLLFYLVRYALRIINNYYYWATNDEHIQMKAYRDRLRQIRTAKSVADHAQITLVMSSEHVKNSLIFLGLNDDAGPGKFARVRYKPGHTVIQNMTSTWTCR